MATERAVPQVADFVHRRLAPEETGTPAEDPADSRYHDLVDDLNVVFWEAVAPDFAVIRVSARAESMLGWPVSDWEGDAGIWRKLIHPDDFERVLRQRRAAVQSGAGYAIEFRASTRAGGTILLRSTVRVVEDPAGGPVLLQGALLDVTPRWSVEPAAIENEERVRRLLDHAADALLVHDTAGRFVEVNRTACDVLGYTRDELIGLQVADVHVDFDADAARSLWESLEPGQSHTFNADYRRSGGATFPVEVRIGLFEWGGRPHIVAVARDTSERKRLEQQLRHSQKMEAVGRLAGGVAHDFNNLLTAIKGHAELLIQEAQGNEQTTKDLAEITRAADRAAVLTRKLLAFSRQQIFAPEVLDLNRIVTETSRLLRPLIGEDIEYRTVTGPIGRVRADHGQIEQVLVNLVVNARDAMRGGGQLTVSTSNLEVVSVPPFRHPFVRPGHYVVLKVTDTGHGMDADTQARIFEPFFTTKEKGKGSGLGLAIAYGIVKQNGGYLIAESEKGRGTSFLVILPRCDLAADRAGSAETAVRVSSESDRRVILVVEDEAPVRSLVCRVLGRDGYTVLEATGGEDALRQIQEYGGAIDLVLTDVAMPDMDGRELARVIAGSRPGIRIILMSGYSDELPRVGIDAGTRHILNKPFTPAELSSSVRDVLGS